MEYKKFGNTYIIRLETGEEVVETFKRFLQEQEIGAGFFTGLGALTGAELGFYDMDSGDYKTKEIKENIEIDSLIGNISTMDGEVIVHPHIVVSNSQMKTFGGHFNRGEVSATVEIHLVQLEGELERKHNKKLDLNLLDL